MADPTLAIETRVLTKQYGRHTAVCDLDLHVPRGAVCGFLGRNGAGKTTTIGMLTGLLHPTRGDAWLLGHDVRRDVRAALRRTGVLLDQPAFYPNLSGRENMWVTAQALGGGAAVRIAEVLDTVDLAERAGDRVGGYSLGMKQRLGLAAALLNDPELLILDEPTAGLDPIGQRAIRTLIRRLAEEMGKTIFLSSHQLQSRADLRPCGDHRSGVAQGTGAACRSGCRPRPGDAVRRAGGWGAGGGRWVCCGLKCSRLSAWACCASPSSCSCSRRCCAA
ncbi:MAG: ATP-binding cassette domain-containing protein [Anaerolineae bacterium]|nr:ATP-binding cassette domain-containing protein [Anaerolineae bacterium]